ncbi:uncharacterized protein PGTG_14046 [Puccinia graminis f. sp. tritici CRL 75-36-700-3]|uniref:Uncharacterized protein n=1 Tax=Puccinia graminis f. sp. tritici (strain CRL 75-36-700-3 / race SCCL) TaxID=418459 RepID=E3KVZ3_PUCGT|nr:uncharacterized protein PGTG_14046 [Puccinia graminis f. sp. tritici CRL 75-36-700-3]EFP88468.2 hypothetical protein PGTG_14046 [Puccinia graminis f. sp. tritici CRL 75-36-700-3]
MILDRHQATDETSPKPASQYGWTCLSVQLFWLRFSVVNLYKVLAKEESSPQTKEASPQTQSRRLEMLPWEKVFLASRYKPPAKVEIESSPASSS